MAGLTFTAVASSTIGLFIEPLSREFGWGRADISAGLTIYALVAIPLSPFVGALVDRWGARRLAIPGMALTALAFSAFSLANGSVAQWLGLWVVYSFVALAIRSTVWNAAVSSVFTKARGLALAVALSGSALTQIFGPIIAQQLIDNHGWRNAYLWMGLGWGSFVLALLVPFFFDARDRRRRAPAVATAAPAAEPALGGLTPKEALQSPALRKIALATFIILTTQTAFGVHLVPLLTERSFSRADAALLAGLAGTVAILGKLLVGWMFDRWSGGWIAALSMAAPALAYGILLSSGSSFALAAIALVAIGYTNGASIHIITYLTSRHGGIRNFGKIFGVIASLVAAGGGVGPLLAGLVYDEFQTYVPLLAAGIPAAIISAILIGSTGPYPQWTEPAKERTHR